MNSDILNFDDEDSKNEGWVTTFADLMSILMCFFVLLLSFSEMDVLKYKIIAGSMNEAFGVQNEVKVKDIPKGTSVIAREFSPGRPNPTAENKIQQVSANTSMRSLDTRTQPPGLSEVKAKQSSPAVTSAMVKSLLKKDSEQLGEDISEKLADEIASGAIKVESSLHQVTIRIRERGSFPSGSALLNTEFLPIMEPLREVLANVSGSISVEGHTDNIPISSATFRSNWELSSARALELAHELLKDERLIPQRFMIVGFADSRPRANNDTPENRALNRRVEIVIKRDLEDSITSQLSDLDATAPAALGDLDIQQSLFLVEEAAAGG